MPCANSRPRPARAAGPPQTDPWAPARTLGWALAFVILAAALTGYIAFATFLINQTIYLTVLGSLLYLVDCIVQDGTEALLKPEAPVGAGLLAMVGLRRNVLAQIVVILQGVARLVALMIAIAAVLEPWGVQSQDMFGALRAAYFGFSFGGVTLSLSSMIGAAAGVRGRAVRHPDDPGLAGLPVPAPDPPRRRGQELGQDDFRLCRRDRRRAAGGRANRPRRPEARAHRRRPVGRHRFRPPDDRQQFRLRPHPACGSAASGSATGWWWEASRDSCAPSTRARPRSRPSIAAP